MEMTRRRFVGFVLAGGGAALAAACGGGGTTSGTTSQQPPGNYLANGTVANIGANHGHVLMVSQQDVAAGVQKTYDISGSAGHSHQVTLTAADMAALRQNTSAGEFSTTALGHSHTITVSCA